MLAVMKITGASRKRLHAGLFEKSELLAHCNWAIRFLEQVVLNTGCILIPFLFSVVSYTIAFGEIFRTSHACVLIEAY